jgi:O-acetyl-ADP-ribose deacetylase (regulator of RNase III)
MASKSYDNASPDASQESGFGPDESNLEEPTADQLERAKAETSRILEDITGNAKGIPVKFFSSSSNTKRIPRLYYINNNKSILIIIQGDITRTKVDAIVNAANEHMTGGSGVDGMIHHAAGDKLYQACKAHKEISRGVRLPTGHSRILLSYNMGPMPYHIINTAGPMYYRREAEECAKQLSSCYKTALSLAALYDLESIGFTAISCGIFGYPADDGAEVALRTVDKCAASVPVVVFVLWDDHIYDAWVKKVQELDFTLFDPETPITEKSVKSNDDDQKKITKNPTNKDIHGQASAHFGPSVIDLSTPHGKEKKPKDETEDSLRRFPSVPTDTSDTQATDTMDQGNDSMENNSQLNSQRTYVLRSVFFKNNFSKDQSKILTFCPISLCL